jgi:thymidine phosphorylase
MARKSKGFGELLNQQRAENFHREGLAKLQEKVQHGAMGDKFAGIVTNPKGEVKMSEVLESFVEPYLDAAQNQSQREKLFSIATIAWNLALLSGGDRSSLIDKMIQAGIKSNDRLAQQDTREIINEMIIRKQKFFADNKRYIIDFQLQDAGSQFHLSVASTLSNPLVAD